MKESKNFFSKFKYVIVLAGILFVSMLTFSLPESFARTWTDNDGTMYTTVPRDCLASDAQGNNKGLYAVYSDGTIMPAEGPIDHGPRSAGGSAPCYYQDQLGLWAGKWDIWGIFDETLTGYVYAPTTSTYTFLLSADDQAWLTFNGAPLITTPYNAHAIATIDLVGGTWYPIQIKYQNRSGSNWFGFLWHLSSKLVVKDGVDFSTSTGSTITNDPQTLASGGREVKTAVADGVTRLVLMLDVPEQGMADFWVDNAAAGALSSLTNQSNTSTSISNIPGVGTSQGEKIFAVYKVPENFVSNNQDAYLSEREITVHVKFHPALGGETTAEQKIKLIRPPVMLIHGIWSDTRELYVKTGFMTYLLGNFANLKIKRIDYTNNSSIYSNYTIVGNAIKSEIYSLRNQGIAISQVDIVAHSMGGVLSRLFAEAGGNYYKNQENYNEGYINKLITVDTPHKGALLAGKLLEVYYRNPVKGPLLEVAVECLLKGPKVSLNGGALSDLRVENLGISNPLKPIDVPSHTIVGDVLDWKHPIDLTVVGVAFRTLAFLDVLFVLPPYPCDLVVEKESQKGGLSGAATDEFRHIHSGGGFGPYVGCMENIQVQELIKFLLNDDPKSSNFSGF